MVRRRMVLTPPSGSSPGPQRQPQPQGGEQMLNAVRSPVVAESPLLTGDEVCDLIRLSRQTVRRMVTEGTFPKPVSVSKKRVAWRRDDVLAWIAKGGRRLVPR